MAKILGCTLVLLMLCGCFDYNELNMQELVSGAGIDVADGGLHVMVACAPTGSEEEKNGAVYSADGESFFDAVRAITGKSDKKLYWGHTKCLIIGESAADELDGILDAVLRARDVYLDITPVVVRGASAEDVLKSKPQSGSDAVVNIAGAFANEDNSRRFSSLSVWELMRERGEGKPYILPTVSIEDDSPVLAGGAVISEGKLLGYLSGEQLLMLSLLTDSGAGGYLPPLSLPDGRSASLEILANEQRREKNGDSVKIVQKCTLSPAEVKGEISDDELRQAAEDFLTSRARELIEYSEREQLGDILETDGRKPEVKCEVRISNILGGGK